jgi:CheY-like chemotaxis protein
MSRILLVDDSPHAQRMGERILSEEGFEVVTVSNADSALIRLEDVDPDVILADTVMPGRTGYEICQFVKMSPRHKHVRVILTAGVLENIDEAQSKRVEADSTLKKPFEASALLAAVRPLAEAAAEARRESGGGAQVAKSAPAAAPVAPFIAVVDAEQVRAAVTVALDAAMEKMVDEIAARVLAAFQQKRSLAELAERAEAGPVPRLASVAAPAMSLSPAAPPAPSLRSSETVRRVTAVRVRTGSILGLDVGRPDPLPETPETPAPSED